MNAAETNIMGMLHSQVILARSKKLSFDRSQIQSLSIDKTAGIRYSLLSMRQPHVVVDASESGMQ